MFLRIVSILAIMLTVTACNPTQDETADTNETASTGETANTSASAGDGYPTTGEIERLSPKLDELIKKDARIEVLAEGFVWSEGPLWVPGHDMLLFADIPPNRIYRWREGDRAAEVYLEPAGYTGKGPRGGEPGANGLVLDSEGRLVMCQHGDRRMARMNAPLDDPQPAFVTLADSYDGKRLNSPNDAVYDSRGNLYFTDPPYGLAKPEDQELPFQGVYRLSTDGELTLLTDQLSRPNGIALSPDEKTLYVANSDPERAIWMAYDITDSGIENGRVFFDATEYVPQAPGLPDGLKIDNQGNLYATGPGGVWIFTPDGEHLGTIKTGQATSNCAFNEDKSALYITADMYLLRVVLK
jgi:gluconolactonase